MIGYLFFDNFGKDKTNFKEKSLTSSLFSFNDITLQLVNAGFYYKKICKMPTNFNLENIKITKDKSIFQICDSYIDFDEKKIVNSIVGICNSLNNKYNPSHEDSLVSLLQTLKNPEKVNKDTFSFFFKNILLPSENINVLPNIPQLIPLYEKELGNAFKTNKQVKPFETYEYFSKKYFFLNLPESKSVEDIINIIKNRCNNNLPLLNFPFFVNEWSLDDFSYILFNKLSEFIPIKIYLLSNNFLDKKWKKEQKLNLNPKLNLEIQNFTLTVYKKNQIISKLANNSENYIHFFNSINNNKISNDSISLQNNESKVELAETLKKELLITKIENKYIEEFENNLLFQGILLKEIGNYYFKMEQHSKAKEFYLKSMELLAGIEEKNEFENVEHNLALIELNLCNTDFCTLYFSNDLKKSETKGDYENIAINSTALGKTYLIQSKFEKALDFTNKALEICKKHNSLNIVSSLYYQLATIFIIKKDKQNVAKYVSLLKKSKDKNIFEKEILFLECELGILEKDAEKTNSILKKIKNAAPHSEIDSLHMEILNSISENKSSEYKMLLFLKAEKIKIPYISTVLKAKLLKSCKTLAYHLDENVIIKEMHFVKQFNSSYCTLYKNALLKKRISKIDSNIFSKLNSMLSLGINRNNEGFQDILTSLGEYLGLGKLKITNGKMTKNIANLVFDNSGKLCITSEKGFDSKLVPFFDFLTNLSATFINSSSIHEKKSTNQCPFLNSIVGNSHPINSLKNKLQQVANFDFPILIEGDSGTGKEMAAQAVHYCSKRQNLPFLPINCAALPENLIESQLFGHKKGAFTGAISDKKGIFEDAGEGTVFLDEIGELTLSTQAKLLRVLQEKEAFKVGENNPYKIKCRFVFATNKNLKTEVEQKTFREDLYYRIAGIVINTPTLNERTEDIPLLAEHFLKPYGKTLSPDAETLIMKHKFNGNVRELQNILTSAIVSSQEESEINGTHLPDNLKPMLNHVFTGQLKKATAKFQKNYIIKVLAETNYNNTKTATKLGITRQRLIQLKKQFEI